LAILYEFFIFAKISGIKTKYFRKTMSTLASNLKRIRKAHSSRPTQSDMAHLLGVSISTYGSYEEGRAEPKLENLQKIASFFGISLGEILNAEENGNPAGERVMSSSASVGNESQPRVLALTLDADGRDNIEWVPVKAAAGYTSGFGDPEFIQELPRFQLPFLDARKKYRAFTIQGDSMLPIPSGAMIFAEYLDNWTQLRDDTACIVVTRTEGIVFKKVFNYLRTQNCLLLVSTNTAYSPYLVGAQDILEIWKFAGFFTDKLESGS
jgi:transcriptional regulator with XRE-family HTH domain